jgi:hypothetical protein
MRRASLYDPATGLISRTLAADCRAAEWDAMLDQLKADGHGVVDGHHDHLSRRVDLATGLVIDYDNPQRAVIAQQATERATTARIRALELAQLRPLRELVLTGSEQARAKLAQIDSEIAAARAELAWLSREKKRAAEAAPKLPSAGK